MKGQLKESLHYINAVSQDWGRLICKCPINQLVAALLLGKGKHGRGARLACAIVKREETICFDVCFWSETYGKTNWRSVFQGGFELLPPTNTLLVVCIVYTKIGERKKLEKKNKKGNLPHLQVIRYSKSKENLCFVWIFFKRIYSWEF